MKKELGQKKPQKQWFLINTAFSKTIPGPCAKDCRGAKGVRGTVRDSTALLLPI